MESYKEELYHHGILGQKWGIRRFQNKDGSLTSEGKKRRTENATEKKEVTKEELLKSTDPKFVYENRDKLTTAELQDRLNRIRSEQELGRLAKNGKSFADKYISKAKKGNEIVRETATTIKTAKAVGKILAIVGGIAIAKIADYLIPNGPLDIKFG